MTPSTILFSYAQPPASSSPSSPPHRAARSRSHASSIRTPPSTADPRRYVIDLTSRVSPTSLPNTDANSDAPTDSPDAWPTSLGAAAQCGTQFIIENPADRGDPSDDTLFIDERHGPIYGTSQSSVSLPTPPPPHSPPSPNACSEPTHRSTPPSCTRPVLTHPSAPSTACDATTHLGHTAHRQVAYGQRQRHVELERIGRLPSRPQPPRRSKHRVLSHRRHRHRLLPSTHHHSPSTPLPSMTMPSLPSSVTLLTAAFTPTLSHHLRLRRFILSVSSTPDTSAATNRLAPRPAPTPSTTRRGEAGRTRAAATPSSSDRKSSTAQPDSRAAINGNWLAPKAAECASDPRERAYCALSRHVAGRTGA